jgi:hypothetical protein
MNQSKTITLDAVLRESILRDIKPTPTDTNTSALQNELTIDEVLRETFQRDTELNKLILTEAVNATKIANQIYNAKGVIWDDEDSAISAIKKIRDSKDWYSVRKKFKELHDKNLQSYLNSFLSTEDLDEVVSHITDILPKKYWQSETSTLKSRIRPYDPATGQQQLNIQRTPERTLKDKNISTVSGYVDKSIPVGSITHISSERQKKMWAAMYPGKPYAPETDTRPWQNKSREKILKNLGAEAIYSGVNTRQYTLMAYSNPKVEKTTTKDEITFTENNASFSAFPTQEFIWKPTSDGIKLYMPGKPMDPEGKLVKQGKKVIWIDNLVAIGGQQYRMDDAGNITSPGQNRQWKDTRTSSYAHFDDMDRLQTFLDWVGLIPVIGDFVDLINAIIYFGRGKTFEGILSLIAVIPVAGSVASLTAKTLYKNFLKILAKYKATKLLNISDSATRKAEFRKLFEKAVQDGGVNGRNAREIIEIVSKLSEYRAALSAWRVTFVRGLNKYKWIPGFEFIVKNTDDALQKAEREFKSFCDDLNKTTDEVISATSGSGKKSAAGTSGKDALKTGSKEIPGAAGKWWKRNLTKISNLLTKTAWRLPKSFRLSQANAIAKWFRKLVVSNPAVLKNILRTMPIADANKIVKTLIFRPGISKNAKVTFGLFSSKIGGGVTDLGTRISNNKCTIDELLAIVDKAFDPAVASKLNINIVAFKNLVASKAMSVGNMVYKEFIGSWWVGFLSYIRRDVPLSLPYWKQAGVPASKYIPELSQFKTAYAAEWGNIWKFAKRADVIYNEYQDVFEKYGFGVDTPNSVFVSILYHILSYDKILNSNQHISWLVQSWQKSDAGQNDATETKDVLLQADRLAHGELPSKLRAIKK